MSGQKVGNINPHILRQCREQIGLSIEVAKQKANISTLANIEKGKIKPTFIQLKKIADLYHVPQWVFLREQLPSNYQFTASMPAFRKFAESRHPVFDYKIRAVMTEVERIRNFILELREDMEEPIQLFSPPEIENFSAIAAASLARKWLGFSEGIYKVEQWRKAIENKDIFIFMTSKYLGWSKIELDRFRGLSIYKDKLPIIIINDSDAFKAQSFTLFHELGHLLQKQNALDSEENYLDQTYLEKWCNEFAGEVLMPRANVLKELKQELLLDNNFLQGLSEIKRVAETFSVSTYACTVRLRNLQIISLNQYKEILIFLRKEHERLKKLQQDNPIRISRNLAKETLRQYGSIYSKAVIQTYRNQEIGLHKLCKLFKVKKVADILKLEKSL